MEKFDFSGWATRNDLLCADGRTIRKNAFADQDGTEVHHLTGAHPANKIKDIIDYHNKTVANYNPYSAKYVENKR